MKEGYFRVGKVLHPMPEDKYYGDERAAIDAAAVMVDAYRWNEPIAVWDDRDEIVNLFLCEHEFRSA